LLLDCSIKEVDRLDTLGTFVGIDKSREIKRILMVSKC
jgi:hypothetical protein